MTDREGPSGIVTRIAEALKRGDEPAALDAAREGYGLYAEGGIDALIDLFSDDVEWSEGSDVPEPEVFHGREGVLRQQRAFAEAWDEVRVTPESIKGDGERAVIVLKLWGRGKGSGAEVEATVAHVWEIRDGLVARMEVYFDPAAAHRAAGL